MTVCSAEKGDTLQGVERARGWLRIGMSPFFVRRWRPAGLAVRVRAVVTGAFADGTKSLSREPIG